MKKYFFSLIITISLIAFNQTTVHAQDSLRKFTLMDESNQTSVNEVLVTWKKGKTNSNLSGEIKIPAGITEISLFKSGYSSITVDLVTLSGQVIYLTPVNNLKEVIISAYPSQVKESTTPASFTLIRKEKIALANQIDFSQVLNNVPGLFMHSGTLGTNRITIRGIGSRTPFGTNKVKAYFNEIPLTAGDGETNLEDNEMSVLGLIEVLRGPSSTSYGAGLAGLIKFSPQKAEESSFSSSYGIGSFGLSRTHQNLALVNSEHALKTSYSTTFSDSYRENNQYDRENFFLNYGYSGQKIQIDFLSTLIAVKSFIPSSVNETDFKENPQVAAGNWAGVRGFEDYTKGLFGLTLSTNITAQQQISGTLFTTFRSNYELRPFGILNESSNLYGGRWKYSNEVSDKFSFVLGGEFSNEIFEISTFSQNERLPVDLTSFNKQNRRNINFFAESIWSPNTKWNVTAGLNYSKISYNLSDLFLSNGDQSGKYNFEGVVSPRLLTSYHFTPDNQIYVQVSHGFSPPSVEETLTPDGLINTDIQPEKGFSYELGLKGFSKNRSLSYQINTYIMNVRNLLVARRIDEDQFVGINAGQSTHKGIEGELSFNKSIEGHLLTTFVNFSASSISFKEFIDLAEDFSGNQLPGVPDYNGNLGIILKSRQGISVNLNYRMVGEMFLRDDNLLSTDSYALLNLKLGYSKSFGRINFMLNAGINNLTDKKYASQILVNAGSFGGSAPRYFYAGLPRNYFSNLSIGYKFQ